MASRPRDTRAKIHRQCIQELEDRQGRITAEKLVQAAADPKHPMHKDFLWDDAKAGHKHRLDQARAFIAQVRVQITTSTKKVVVPAYVRDMDASPRQGMRSIARVQTDREAALETLLYETTRLQAMLERCREIAAGLELEEELDLALTAIRDLTGRIRMRAAPAPLHAS